MKLDVIFDMRDINAIRRLKELSIYWKDHTPNPNWKESYQDLINVFEKLYKMKKKSLVLQDND